MGVLDKFRLDGKVAIVTGASRGLGQGMAVGLAEAGADVALVARGDLAATADLVRATGRQCFEIKADMADTKAPARILQETLDAFGRVDIVVNNAGTIRRGTFLEFSEKDWDDVLAVNLKSLFLLSQVAARQMVKQGGGGKIIHVASMLSYQGGVKVASYTAAKSGVMGLTRIMANELGPLGINCNAIAPGYMATDNTQPLRDDPERNKAILDRIPMGRWGTPEDLMGAVVFLASAASDYMNGYTVAVDGGWLAR